MFSKSSPSDVPDVTLSHLFSPTPLSWSEIDNFFSEWIGKPVIFVPSIRVAINWILDTYQFSRNTSDILVPKYLGRCILNSLTRNSFPVHHPTSKTKAALIVDQFGRKQNLNAIHSQIVQSEILILEDSPYSINYNEHCHKYSLGRFIGLSKVLPIVMGGIFMSSDENLLLKLATLRQRSNFSSYLVWFLMASQRFNLGLKSTTVAEIAYESYNSCAGTSFFLRANITSVLNQLSFFVGVNQERYQYARHMLGDRLLSPKALLNQQLAILPYDIHAKSFHIPQTYKPFIKTMMIDLNNNMLNPNYISCFSIPMNNDMPLSMFQELVDLL